jgi:hypothetical protein
MNALKELYLMRNLYKNGIFILITSISILVIGLIIIPEFKPKPSLKQLFNTKGLVTKYNDKADFEQFITSIKSNDGYLVLGTSESTFLNGKNYFDFLNNDPKIEAKFSVLAGAGRTCGLYIPLLLDHREILDSLKLIYFINPVYWREDLCQINEPYWNRYSNYKVVHDVNLTANERENYYQPVEKFSEKIFWFQKIYQSGEKIIRDLKNKYSRDLYYKIYPKKYQQNLNYIIDYKDNTLINPNLNQPNFSLFDTIFNIKKTFKDKHWFYPINQKIDYRYEELISFINLTKYLKIDALFIIGPYNERFIQQYSPKSLRGYQITTQKLKQILGNNTKYIDATSISGIVGAFDDHQHHSEFGAFLIYKKIKDHLYEANR